MEHAMRWPMAYFKVDLNIVWKTVERDLQVLEEQVDDVLQALSRDGASTSS